MQTQAAHRKAVLKYTLTVDREGVNRINLAQNRGRRLAFVKTEINLSAALTTGNFLTRCATLTF